LVEKKKGRPSLVRNFMEATLGSSIQRGMLDSWYKSFFIPKLKYTGSYFRIVDR
jgi:hypothetical protein